jgi:hypothetical protein
MPETKHDAILRKEDLLSIENTLFEAKEEELVLRSFIDIDTNFNPNAEEIGYDWYSRTGSAKIMATGASAKDIPFVDEKGGRVTMKVYDAVTGIRFKYNELRSMQAKAALGKGPAVLLDTLRVKSARRFVAEAENRIGFVGNGPFKIPGLLNHPGVTSVNVAAGASTKTTWADKTPDEILADLLLAKGAVEEGDLFRARVLVLPSAQKNLLLKRLSATDSTTILKWLESEGAYFERIITTSFTKSANNGINFDAFMVLDNDPEVVQLSLPQEMQLGDPVYDLMGNSEQAVFERIAGIMLRHPTAVYVGKKI